MIVVTGATGNVGRTLVRLLTEAGEPVTAVSRNITGSDVPRGVPAVAADLADPASLRPALDGADAMFLLISGNLTAAVGDPSGVVSDLLDDAKARGVGRIVLLSSQGVATRPDSPSHGSMGQSVEDAVRRSGMDWTILRPGGFASNAYAWAESVRTRRTVAAPFGDVGLPFIDPADIAEVAAAALRVDGHAGQVYELTGPALTTPRQRAEAIGDAVGEPVRFIEQTREEARAQMLEFMPEPVVETTLAIIGEPTPAEQRISPDVERILGRAPRAFADWARRNAAAFR
ncbi:SDR family oxidoreductase [Streptosporangium minutum]|uniref:NmrA family transcriptional regulator n=1 Tax=Streptosporangium minutum TaxID=569862 RepID=A0A243RSC2_9ACTN|nr:NAD(P)H-binding protein [Streptosporangium minutum]OUC97789.1 NmrA family transcriptional regulator [Streptosporangium minutum]